MDIDGGAKVSPLTTSGINAGIRVSVEVSKNNAKFCIELTVSAVSSISIANTWR